jgi:hypothetical protein
LDRLSRSLEKQLLEEEELKRNGLTVKYVLSQYPDTPEGDLHLRHGGCPITYRPVASLEAAPTQPTDNM